MPLCVTRMNILPLVILAGKEYGTGSSRDWAAKGTLLLGVIEKASRPFLTFLKVAFAICFALAGIGIGCLYAQLQHLPDIKLLQTTSPSQATRIYDINGEVISQLWLEQRTLVSLDKIPLTLQNALIAIEDDRFYRHIGIDPIGIARAFIQNIS